MATEGNSPETKYASNQHYRNTKDLNIFKKIHNKVMRQPSFPETPKGYSRYFTGWNLEAFQLCFKKEDSTFDKSLIQGPYHADRIYFFPENKRPNLPDFKGNPIKAAATWSLRRQGLYSYGKNYVPIIISGLVESARVTLDDISYFTSEPIKIDRVFKIIGDGNNIKRLVDITDELLSEDKK